LKVFISWSKERSLKVATALSEWLPQVINAVDPWMSAKSIESGKLSIQRIGEALETTNFGIICVTPENQHETWLNFEAGALGKAVGGGGAHAIPLLIGFGSFAELGSPLNSLQAHMATKEDVHKIVATLNGALGAAKRSDALLDASFEKWWPDLDVVLSKASSEAPAAVAPQAAGTDDILTEILEKVRTLTLQPGKDEAKAPPRIEPMSSREGLRRLLLETVNDAVDPDLYGRFFLSWGAADSVTVTTEYELPSAIRLDIAAKILSLFPNADVIYEIADGRDVAMMDEAERRRTT
jgi:hypothetical protein